MHINHTSQNHMLIQPKPLAVNAACLCAKVPSIFDGVGFLLCATRGEE